MSFMIQFAFRFNGSRQWVDSEKPFWISRIDNITNRTSSWISSCSNNCPNYRLRCSVFLNKERISRLLEYWRLLI
ncbi:hypothetical protein X975_03785, partial [Stegodyphus mimosarum]